MERTINIHIRPNIIQKRKKSMMKRKIHKVMIRYINQIKYMTIPIKQPPTKQATSSQLKKTLNHQHLKHPKKKNKRQILNKLHRKILNIIQIKKKNLPRRLQKKK